MPLLSIDQLLHEAVRRKSSDLHLTAGQPPLLRVDGKLTPMAGDPLTPDETQVFAQQLLTPAQISRFEQTFELDTAYSIKGLSRFRVNCYRQRGSVGIAIRTIPFEIPSLEALGMPPILKEFADRPSGLVIVSGPTGAGKSTTLAAMIDYINQRRNCHIVSIEDPIEYLHRHRRATINQRELGIDTISFHEALRHVVRQDPNIILIGEMRDLETMHAALTLAETGHLVFTTLHTGDATHVINRIVDVFSPHQQLQIRIQLSLVLVAVVVQQLIPRASGQGRVVAYEIMHVTPAIAGLIRDNNLHQIKSTIQTGRRFGMNTMTQSLAELYRAGLVTWDEIVRRSTDPNELATLVQAGQPA